MKNISSFTINGGGNIYIDGSVGISGNVLYTIENSGSGSLDISNITITNSYLGNGTVIYNTSSGNVDPTSFFNTLQGFANNKIKLKIRKKYKNSVVDSNVSINAINLLHYNYGYKDDFYKEFAKYR